MPISDETHGTAIEQRPIIVRTRHDDDLPDTGIDGCADGTSENGRGLKEVLRAVGVHVTDRRAGEWVVGGEGVKRGCATSVEGEAA